MTSVIAKDRRQRPRFPVRHLAHLLCIATVLDGKLPANYLPLTLMGRTLNISETGLMLMVKASQINENYLAAKDYALRVVVAIPAGPVEIYACPMHYEQAQDGAYLIGARIEKMDSDERERLLQYLQDYSDEPQGAV
ncbi:MAG TPA: PilZ domain-containing protein [Pyrinomonadaceae bacterium]|jgi:hypothetical protein